ncbi:conserved hypothetical protein [Listeria monocytogenes FSL R2-503]|nr:conserved hypothetical protein [Listeria monocytogenes FSL R2-503]
MSYRDKKNDFRNYKSWVIVLVLHELATFSLSYFLRER